MNNDNIISPESQAANREIMMRFPEFRRKKTQLGLHNIQATAVVIPKRLCVPYEGEDAEPDFKGTLMGLPIEWSDEERWGLVIPL